MGLHYRKFRYCVKYKQKQNAIFFFSKSCLSTTGYERKAWRKETGVLTCVTLEFKTSFLRPEPSIKDYWFAHQSITSNGPKWSSIKWFYVGMCDKVFTECCVMWQTHKYLKAIWRQHAGRQHRHALQGLSNHLLQIRAFCLIVHSDIKLKRALWLRHISDYMHF